MSHSITVIGAGAWGTALASAWATKGHKVILIGRDPDHMQSIKETGINEAYLPNIQLPSSLKVSTDLSDVAQSTLIACVTPAQTFSKVLDDISAHLNGADFIILCSKGIDRASGLPLMEIARDKLGLLSAAPAILSGPSFAHDVARGLPTAVSLAATNPTHADSLRETLSTERFRIYSTTDAMGVELGGALKNVMALAVGMARGLELGASAEAALISRGFAEMTRLAVKQGAKSETLTGLSGLGDLVLTCSSPQSRNFAYGMALGRGESLENRPLAEGVFTADMALAMAKKHNVDVPIIETVCRILQHKIKPIEAVSLLLNRPLKSEEIGG